MLANQGILFIRKIKKRLTICLSKAPLFFEDNLVRLRYGMFKVDFVQG